MHCFACNILLNNPQLDKPTGRYYCDACLESTVEVQLKLAGKDYYDFTFIETETEKVPFENPKDNDDEDFNSSF